MNRNIEAQVGEPVHPYTTEEAAKAAVAKAQAARQEFRRLWDEAIEGHPTPCAIGRCAVRKERYRFASKDGSFYDSEAAREYADRRFDFGAREDVKALRAQMTGEDYYIAMTLCE